MSEVDEVRRGGDSRMTMFLGGMNALRWDMIVACICFVSLIVRDCLCLVCLASFVSVLMTTMSFGLNVRCWILLRVWGKVNVSWGLML